MYAFRQAELVGKRFLCVRAKNCLRPNSRSSRVSNPLDYQWKVGVIRTCNEQDVQHPELKVLVEYDDEDWTTREWLKIHDGSWKIFLVEKTMVWSQRSDPSNPRRSLLWPALNFFPLVDYHGLSEEDHPIPVEFVGDHERVFVRKDQIRTYGQDDDALQPVLRNNPVVMEELRAWQHIQKSQSILLDGPFTLTGFRVKVYRQTCRQWFSAVITGHDLISRELSVMDDTVLQTHRVNPRLIQVILLANETELDSLLRGELVRVLPMRQHRHSQVIITAPLTTQTTTTCNSHPSAAPSAWQLYAGLTQGTNSNNLANSSQAAYTATVGSMTTRRSTACSPSNTQATATAKERRKSSETRNRSSSSRRVTKSESANSPSSSNDSLQQTPQTLQSSFTSSSATPVTSSHRIIQTSFTSSAATPLTSSHRTATNTSTQITNKTSPEASTSSPKNSSSSSSVGSPSSTLQKKSPVKQPMSPKTSPTMLQYSSPPASKAGMSRMGSPFRSNLFCSSPDMSSVVSMASPMSGMSHMGMHSPAHVGHSSAQSPHPLYTHPMGHLNLSPNQLYALQLQQQQQQMQAAEQQEFLTKLRQQHYQSLLHQYQMHQYQLQLMLQQQELIQQMPLTPEQQHILVEYYNQLLYQYQCAQYLQALATLTQEEQLSMFPPNDEQGIRTLPERIQQQLLEDQRRQKEELQNLMPRLEPEQLQAFFTCLQQRQMTPDQIKQLYSLMIQQQQQQAQRRCAQGDQHEDEQQEEKIQQYLRQNQEQVQKFLQLPKSPSFPQDHECKQEPKQEASSSSSQQESPSSSPFPPSSSASSFTVHYPPTSSGLTASSTVNSEDKAENKPCVPTPTLESPRQQTSVGADEIELTSTTTEGERSSSPHTILEKLLQHHLKAVEDRKQGASAKTRRTRTSSTEKRTRRQRTSTDSSSTRVQNKDSSDLKNESRNVEISDVVPDSSAEKISMPSSLTGSASRVQEFASVSMNQNLCENKEETIVNEQKLPRKEGIDDSRLAEEKNQSEARENNTASKTLGLASPVVREESLQKTTPNVPTRDIVREVPPEGVMLRGSETTQNGEPSVNVSESKDISKSEETTLVRKCSEKTSLKGVVANETKSSVLRSLLEKTSPTTEEKVETINPANLSTEGVIPRDPQTSELKSLLKQAPSTVPVKEGSKPSNSKLTRKGKEWVELTTLRGMKKSSVKVTDKVSQSPPPLSLSNNIVCGATELPANFPEKNHLNHAQDETSNTMEVDTPVVSQKPCLNSGTKESRTSVRGASKLSANVLEKQQLNDLQNVASNAMEVEPTVVSQKPEAKDVTTNCFSTFSSDGAEQNGGLFRAREIKTYLKKVTPNKRKSISKESVVEDDSVCSKALKVDNSESSPIDIKKLVRENRKVELGKPTSMEFLSSQPEQNLPNREEQNVVLPTEKSKKSRKKSTGESNLQTKKAKSEDNSVKRLELREKNNSVVNSVSFVADQAVKNIAINHSPTTKDAPVDQFEVKNLNNERLNKSKERIREMARKKNQLKAKEQKRKEKKNASRLSPVNVKDEPLNGESFETVVDSVLDEEIAVIYNSEGPQDDEDQGSHYRVKSSKIKKEAGAENGGPIESEEKAMKQRKKQGPTIKDAVKNRKRRAKKRSESDGDAVSPNSEQFFLQDRVCAQFSHLPKCRDCRDDGEKTGMEFCRFNMFRRLKKRKNGRVLAAGFQLPEHAAAEDFLPWVEQDKAERMDKNTSLYVLFNVGDQFCSVMQEEKKAITQAGEKVSVAYKRAVQGVREMCDVCATTIFNVHWVCHRCGFGVCLDCYNLRVKEREEQPVPAGKRVFEFKWCMCGPGICHQPKYLSVAQIIPKTVLCDLGDELHRARKVWDIGKTCPCKSFVSSQDNESGSKITELSKVEMNTDNKEEHQNESNDSCAGKEEASEASVKTEAASNSANQNPNAMDSESSFEGSDDVNLICDESLGVDSPSNHEQEWLTEEKRRNLFTKKAGFGLVEAKPPRDKGISAGLSLLMDYNSSTEPSPNESPANSDVKSKTGAFNFSFSSGLDLLVLACEEKEGLPMPNNDSMHRENKKLAEKSKPDPLGIQKDEEIKNVLHPVATPSESTSAESSDDVRPATPPVPGASDTDACTDVPHSWLCDGRLLRLHEPRAPGNIKVFEKRWKKGEPVLVSHVDKYLNLDIWTPKSFGQEFGDEIADVVNCRNGVVIERFKVGDFWEGFESIKDRPVDNNGEPMLLKLKDWPPKDDFSEKLPTRFEDLMNNVPLPEYTRRDGSRNLVSRLPEFFVKPDLGPKMYNAYGSAACPKEGTTNLHLDMSDAVNVMVYVGVPRDQGAGEKERDDAIKAVDEACDESQRQRVRQETARIGALWHIYAAEDADKIRECLREIIKERKMKHSSHHDPIHDQCFYLDHDIRQRLKKDYGVEGWAICQCLGDAVFIPAGAPHQVRNLYSCVKVAEDFVSPERIDHCFRMTQEFRHLSDKHTNHEDKLQVKNIIYHAVKDALSSLRYYEQEGNSSEPQKEADRAV